MIFLGSTFCAGRNTIDATATKINNITTTTVKNGIFNDVYISEYINREYTTMIPTLWDYDTVMYAKFENNLSAGNVNFTLETVSEFRIKKRLKGSFYWTTIFSFPVNELEDLTFIKYDRYVSNKHTYEYLLVPVINDIEGDVYISEITPYFEGLFIVEKEDRYSTLLDVSINTQKNKPSAIVNTIGRKYPYIVMNGQNNYYSGSVSAVFIERTSSAYTFDLDGALIYRANLLEFLHNGKPKILKYDDGRVWMINIVESSSESIDTHPEKVITNFNFVEIGDVLSGHDLYYNNFIDVVT